MFPALRLPNAKTKTNPARISMNPFAANVRKVLSNARTATSPKISAILTILVPSSPFLRDLSSACVPNASTANGKNWPWMITKTVFMVTCRKTNCPLTNLTQKISSRSMAMIAVVLQTAKNIASLHVRKTA